MKFPDDSPTVRGTRHVKCYSYHARSSVGVGMQQYMIQNHILRHNRLLLNTCMVTNMQFTINSFRQLFPNKIFFSNNSLIFSKIPTFPFFPDKWSPWITRNSNSTCNRKLSQRHVWQWHKSINRKLSSVLSSWADWMTQRTHKGLGAWEERRSRTLAQRPRMIAAEEQMCLRSNGT